MASQLESVPPPSHAHHCISCSRQIAPPRIRHPLDSAKPRPSYDSYDDKMGCYAEDLDDLLAAAAARQNMRALVPAMLALPHQDERDYRALNNTVRTAETLFSHPDELQVLFMYIATHRNRHARCWQTMLPGFVYFSMSHRDPWTRDMLYPENSNSVPAPTRTEIGPCRLPRDNTGYCPPYCTCIHALDPGEWMWSFFRPGESPAYDQLMAMPFKDRGSAMIRMRMECPDLGFTFIGLILEAAPSDVDDNLVDLSYHMFSVDLRWTILRKDLASLSSAFVVRRNGL